MDALKNSWDQAGFSALDTWTGGRTSPILYSKYFQGVRDRMFGQFIQSVREKAGRSVEEQAAMAAVVLLCRRAWETTTSSGARWPIGKGGRLGHVSWSMVCCLPANMVACPIVCASGRVSVAQL